MSMEEVLIDGIKQNYERVVNRVQIHKHNLYYCLKQVSKRKMTKDKDSNMEEEQPLEHDEVIIKDILYKCRFGFEQPLVGYHPEFVDAQDTQLYHRLHRDLDQNGQAQFPEGARILSKPSKKIQFLRNHPMVNEHIKELLLAWRANIDSKAILSLLHLNTYVMKYTTKSELASKTYKSVAKAIIAEANEDSPAIKLLQRLLFKTATRDISRQEACLMLSKKHEYVKCSLKAKSVSLLNNKRIKIEAENPDANIVVDKNLAEIYWSRESDENYLKVSSNLHI